MATTGNSSWTHCGFSAQQSCKSGRPLAVDNNAKFHPCLVQTFPPLSVKRFTKYISKWHLRSPSSTKASGIPFFDIRASTDLHKGRPSLHQFRLAATNSASPFPGSSAISAKEQVENSDHTEYNRDDRDSTNASKNQDSSGTVRHGVLSLNYTSGGSLGEERVEATEIELNESGKHISEWKSATSEWDGTEQISSAELSTSGSNYKNENDKSYGGYINVCDTSYDLREKTSDNVTVAPSLASSESPSVGVKEPVYEVIEVEPQGNCSKKTVSRRQLLRNTAGLRLRDLRSVDPSLWLTNSVPALLVRDQAILLNMGSLKAICSPQNVLIFDHKSVGAQAFLHALLPRLTNDNDNCTSMPFELEVVEAALTSRTQRLEKSLMEVQPKVQALLEVLPNRLTANVLEELRLSKQALVELGSKAGALRQMLLELLEHPQDIRRMTIMGRFCTIGKDDGSVECSTLQDKQLAEDEEQEIEMLFEYYLQRCETCHGQAEKLLDSAREMEESISVNLSSRRLEVSRLELLLQVGTFCAALGALVAGIFGMNLRSYLEEHVFAFWLTSGSIVVGGIALYFVMFSYLKHRRIL